MNEDAAQTMLFSSALRSRIAKVVQVVTVHSHIKPYNTPILD